eukprot:g2619.t1
MTLVYPWRRYSDVVLEYPFRQDCECVLFIPENTNAPPRYIAATYQLGMLSILDSQAFTTPPDTPTLQSELLSLSTSSSRTIDMKALATDSDTILFTLSSRGTLQLWSWNQIKSLVDDRSISEIAPLVTHETFRSRGCITSIGVNTESRQLITGDISGCWKCWDIERMNSHLNPVVSVHSGHNDRITKIDGDGGIFASASDDGTVCVWDSHSTSCISALDPSTSKALPLNKTQRYEEYSTVTKTLVSFDKGGRYVAAIGKNQCITVWNIRSDSAQCVLNLQGDINAMDSTKNSIFCDDREGFISRYSILDPALITSSRSHLESTRCIHVSKEDQDRVLVAGGYSTVEIRSPEGEVLGLSSQRRHLCEYDSEGGVSHGQSGELASDQLIGRLFDEEDIEDDEDMISEEDYSHGDNDDICDFGSDGMSCSEGGINAFENHYIYGDDFSSILSFSDVVDDIQWSPTQAGVTSTPTTHYHYPQSSSYSVDQPQFISEGSDVGRDFEFSQYSASYSDLSSMPLSENGQSLTGSYTSSDDEVSAHVID